MRGSGVECHRSGQPLPSTPALLHFLHPNLPNSPMFFLQEAAVATPVMHQNRAPWSSMRGSSPRIPSCRCRPPLDSQRNAASPPRIALAGESPEVSRRNPPCRPRVSALISRAGGRGRRGDVDLP
jgi:hypothetical protein